MNRFHVPHESDPQPLTPAQVQARAARRDAARRGVWLASVGLGAAAVVGTGAVAVVAAASQAATTASDATSDSSSGSSSTNTTSSQASSNADSSAPSNDSGSAHTTVQAPTTTNQAPAAATHTS